MRPLAYRVLSARVIGIDMLRLKVASVDGVETIHRPVPRALVAEAVARAVQEGRLAFDGANLDFREGLPSNG